MVTSESSNEDKSKKYIPGLAAFRFRPEPDWSHSKSRELYYKSLKKNSILPIDKVLYEDCIKGMKILPDRSIDLIIADPPFGLNFTGKESIYNRDNSFVKKGYRDIPDDSYWKFSEDWISCLPRIMKDDASAYIFSGWTNLEAVLAATRRAGLETINHIIWHYQFGVFTQRKYVTSHYVILFVVKDKQEYYYRKAEHYPEDVWEIPRRYRQGQEKNGTALPIDIISKCISFSSKPGDIVFDPFMGNGTTAMASKGNWRHYLGFEINRKMKSVIEANIDSVEVGSLYETYEERFPLIIEELMNRYPKAYRIWQNQQSEVGCNE